MTMEVGSRVTEVILEPVTGKALPVRQGQVMRISQMESGQCVDFNAFNLHDYKERMSIGHSRLYGLHLVQGDLIFTNPPRHRPLIYLADVPDTCVTDTLGARCHAVMFEEMLGFAYHTNCQDTLAEAIREYGLSPDDVHDSFNMFFNTRWDAAGRFWIEPNTGEPGDHIDLLACMDALFVPNVCGSGDVQFTSNFYLKPLRVEVFAASPETRRAVAEIVQQHTAPNSRQTLEDYSMREIRTERELRRDPEYAPRYRRHPLKVETLDIVLDEEVAGALGDAVSDGFAADLRDAVRRAFMTWYLSRIDRNQSQREGGPGSGEEGERFNVFGRALH